MTKDEITTLLLASPSPDRITPDYMRSRIVGRTFFRPTGTLTICVLTLDNGFTVTGESACAAPENYNQDIGEHYAEERAFEKLWPLFGFALKEAMAARAAAAPADYRDRVRAERDELSGKLDKLRGFLKVDTRADDLMREQERAMHNYLAILDERIKAFSA